MKNAVKEMKTEDEEMMQGLEKQEELPTTDSDKNLYTMVASINAESRQFQSLLSQTFENYKSGCVYDKNREEIK